jgi:DnaJ-class molecular chaperone
MGFRDYYSILKIRPDSDKAEIKNAYRKLVSIHHPDKHRQDAADTAPFFLDIREAYDVLSDPGKRVEYDRLYEKEMNIQRRAITDFPEPGESFGQSHAEGDADDFFDDIFRRFFGFGQKKSSRRRSGDSSDHIHYDDLL